MYILYLYQSIRAVGLSSAAGGNPGGGGRQEHHEGSELNEAVATGRGVLRINTGFAFPGITIREVGEGSGVGANCGDVGHEMNTLSRDAGHEGLEQVPVGIGVLRRSTGYAFPRITGETMQTPKDE
ncbi:uncharacterized protein [Triticum aestivum]|uniref:uncharacterized protein n=1 Tax=Triticum aestivum TaxID=4565 RepID=UPI001D023A4C|nr:uncharacterized protein LOC123062558 [Triticum aestivum]